MTLDDAIKAIRQELKAANESARGETDREMIINHNGYKAGLLRALQILN